MSNDERTSKPAHQVTIVVNGQPKTVEQTYLTYAEVVLLAFNPFPTSPNVMFLVTYRRGHGEKPEGSLVEGQSVKVKEDMFFDVTTTDKS